jgi:hypothetical protein
VEIKKGPRKGSVSMKAFSKFPARPVNFGNILPADPGFISASKEVMSVQVLSYCCKCLGLLLVVFLATLWPLNVLAQSDPTKDYPTFHRNPQRTGWIPNETKLTPANVKGGQFGPLSNLT